MRRTVKTSARVDDALSPLMLALISPSTTAHSALEESLSQACWQWDASRFMHGTDQGWGESDRVRVKALWQSIKNTIFQWGVLFMSSNWEYPNSFSKRISPAQKAQTTSCTSSRESGRQQILHRFTINDQFENHLEVFLHLQVIRGSLGQFGSLTYGISIQNGTDRSKEFKI